QYIKNAPAKEGKGVFNGDMGTISAIDKQTGEITVIFEGDKICTYNRTDISQLSLAYAITIHKSQGSEFDAVVIPAIAGPNIIFNRNLIYTAITRAKKLVVLVGEKRHLWQMVRNKFTLKRHTLLCHFLKESSQKANMLFG
ncbi:MAG: ATP-binding domain-containing protein, partial [Clostridia bacterium]|nr:ATP-binding domain-containing protein [Clostridia bacterium]